MITRAQCDELLAFLPAFENPGPELKATWLSMEPDPETGVIEWPHPTNHPKVDEFFEVAAQPWWQTDWLNSTVKERMREPADVASATLDDIKAMLTRGVRGQRFSDGLQDSMVRGGWVVAILRRLAALREEI